MATITSKGVEKTTLFEYKTLLQTAYKEAIGGTISLIEQSPIGQQVGIDSITYSRIDDQIIESLQQLNIQAAQGVQLDNFAATFSLPVRSATNSLATVKVTGTPGTTITQGALAKTVNNDLFKCVQDIIIQSDSEATGQFIAVESGTVAILANTLTQIVTAIPGWDSINNAQDGTIGSTKASDTEYRKDYYARLGLYSRGTIEALTASVSTVSGVLEVKIYQNDTSENITLQNVVLLPHSIAVIVEGGDATAIANAIRLKKSAGVGTKAQDVSLQTEVVFPAPILPIYFFYVQFVVVAITVTIRQFLNVPNVETQIKNQILSYFDGTFDDTIPKIGIGDTLYKSRLYTPINSVRGFEVDGLTIEIAGSGDQESITPNLNQKLITTADAIGVNIVL